MKKILIVGAGPVGITVAQKLKSLNVSIDIVDKRNHIAGNCYDFYNKKKILVHKYGPHYFRTNKKSIIKYLSNFTDWIKSDYIVKSKIGNIFYDFPINLNTLEKFFNTKLTKYSAKKILNAESTRAKKPKNFEDYLISKIGKKLYEAFYKNYTIKQWGISPKKIPIQVAKRIPIKLNRNQEYIISKFKFTPKKGFTALFNKMIESNKNINVKLNYKFKNNNYHKNKYDLILYTGPIDAFFEFKLGKLNWRSLSFKFKNFKKQHHQKYLQINYPNKFSYTRSVEYKYITKQKSKYTSVSYEYPRKVGGGRDPYYPINTVEDKILYKKYLQLTKKLYPKFLFAGRLAEYTYINTDEAIEKALQVSNKIKKILTA
jgi:UDP-galactopyranose mutase